jgi:hypothetical protein
MPVEVTAWMNRPSNRASRLRTAARQAGSSMPAILAGRAGLCQQESDLAVVAPNVISQDIGDTSSPRTSSPRTSVTPRRPERHLPGHR